MNQGPDGTNEFPMRSYLDAYAMREYLIGSVSYRKYFESGELSTSILNLMELYYILLRDEGDEYAEKSFVAFKPCEVPIQDEDIRAGMKFRMSCKAKRENISYGEAIGYTMARRLKAYFLMGDDAFEGKPAVQFVK
jgi:hypothetical protein